MAMTQSPSNPLTNSRLTCPQVSCILWAGLYSRPSWHFRRTRPFWIRCLTICKSTWSRN